MTLVERIAEAAEAAPSPSGERRLYRAVRQGLPTSAVDALKAAGLTPQEIAHTVAPRRTLSHRRTLGRLTPDQSDRLVRLARIIDHAIDTFGDDERAFWWLRRPTSPLDGEAPIALLDTDDGLRRVEALLERIDHGLSGLSRAAPMRLWRIARRRYADLSGAGAKRLGGRWNSPGSAVVYTAADAALAALEVLVHLDLPFDQLPPDYLLIEIESGTAEIEFAEPIEPDECRSFGDTWLAERRTPLLRVPSAIVPESANVLVNPAHPDAAAVSIVAARPWRFDQRLF